MLDYLPKDASAATNTVDSVNKWIAKGDKRFLFELGEAKTLPLEF